MSNSKSGLTTRHEMLYLVLVLYMDLSGVIMPSLAPALTRGIEVFRLLGNLRNCSLDKLASITKIPKSSLLRLLATLSDLNLIRKNDAGLYSAAACIVPAFNSSGEFKMQLDIKMQLLADKTSRVAEYYVRADTGMQLIMRAIPHDFEIGVRARIGFLRELGGELDAVAMLAYAYFFSEHTYRNSWIYDKTGNQKRISIGNAKMLIDEARVNNMAQDVEFNSGGFSRIATLIEGQDGTRGILAAIGHRTPKQKKEEQFTKNLMSDIYNHLKAF